MTDTSGNGVAAKSSSFSVSIPDNSPPVASTPSAPDITTANGSDSDTVTVVYTDAEAVSAGTIGTADLTVSGGPSTVDVTGFSTSTSSNTSPITATYTIAKANGEPWAFSDDGSYTISVVAGSVKDTAGNGVAAKSGSFDVSIADTSAPVASSISAPNISVVGGDTNTITVVYTDSVAVSAGTIATSNITVTGGPSSIDITSVSISPQTNSSLITATYTVTKANGQPWAFADNGTYTITVLADSVKDTNGLGVALRTGSFTVSEPQPDTTPPTDTIKPPTSSSPAERRKPSPSSTPTTSPSTPQPSTTPASPSPAPATRSRWRISARFPLPMARPSLPSTSSTPPATPGPPPTTERTPSPFLPVTCLTPAATPTSPTASRSSSPLSFPPVAVLTAPNVTAPGGTTEAITAVYTGTLPINTSTIQKSNITVTGPGPGPGASLTVASVSTTGLGQTITATYIVDAPGGAWAASANGGYTVSLAPNSVKDTGGNAVGPQMTTFTVNATVPDTTPPAVSISAPGLTSASLLPEQIVIVYTDSAGVDASTIRPSNLTVTGPDGALTVASVTDTPAGNGPTVTATYSITPPGSGWTSAANGTYTVTLNANQVKDTIGNISPSKSTDFIVNIPQPTSPIDTTFNGGNPVITPFEAEAAAVLSDGQMLIVGHQGNLGTGASQGVIEMLNANGTIARGFGNNGLVLTPAGSNEAYYDVLVQGSDFLVAGSDGGFLVQRYTLTGQLDPSFGTSGSVVTNFGSANEAAYTLAISPSGDIAAGGTSTGFFAFAEYNSNGSLVSSFGQSGRQLFDVGGATNVVGKMLFQPNGDLLAVGGSGSSVALVRLNTSGNADSTFGSSGLVIVPDLVANASVSGGDRSEGLALESDGDILVANSTSAGHFGLVELDSSGNLVTTFGTNGLATSAFGTSDDADAVFIQPGGSIVVLGTTNANGGPTAIAAFNQNGDPVASFGNLGQATVSSGVSSSELNSGGSITSSFGIQNGNDYLVVGASSGSTANTSVRRLIVPGTSVQNTGTPLGAFGISGKKNLKLTFTLANHTKVTLSLTNGAGQAYLGTNGVNLVITATAKGSCPDHHHPRRRRPGHARRCRHHRHASQPLVPHR